MTGKRRKIRGAEVFFSEPGEPKPSREVRRKDIKTEKLNDVKRERVNYYLNSRLVEALDKVQAEIRSLTKKKVSKSDIVSVAIEQALKEFKGKRQDSNLLRAFSE